MDIDYAKKAVKTGKRKRRGVALYGLFWESMKSDSCTSDICHAKRCAGFCQPQDYKVRVLQAFEQFHRGKNATASRHKRRHAFNKSFGFRLLETFPCFVCGGSPNHRHHIIQLQHGGGNSVTNIVPLCASCHRRVHSHAF